MKQVKLSGIITGVTITFLITAIELFIKKPNSIYQCIPIISIGCISGIVIGYLTLDKHVVNNK